MRPRGLKFLSNRVKRSAGGVVHPAERYVRRPETLRTGNAVQLLRGGGEAFPAMLAAIAAARSYVHLETFIWYADTVGRRFAEALIDCARDKVTVRVVVDALGSFGLDDGFYRALREAGVQVIEYRPIAPWRPRWGLNRRNHKKVLVVDGEVGFVGGINIGDLYAPIEDGGGGWYDVHARVAGPIVLDLARSFRRTWLDAGGASFEEDVHVVPAPEEAGDARARVIDNYGMVERSRMRSAYIHAMAHAHKRICLTNSYFIPDRGLRRAFRRAVRRGVDVRIIVPANSDVRVVQLASRHLYPRLLRDGVAIHEWKGHMMHAKTAVIDKAWSTIGSYNIDMRSFMHNHEVSVVVLDEELARTLEQWFDEDLEQCRSVTLEECLARPFWIRALQWLAYSFRYWL